MASKHVMIREKATGYLANTKSPDVFTRCETFGLVLRTAKYQPVAIIDSAILFNLTKNSTLCSINRVVNFVHISDISAKNGKPQTDQSLNSHPIGQVLAKN